MITIVSGLACEGKSLMMKVLNAGGLRIIKDHELNSDCKDLKNLFEYEKIEVIKSHPAWFYDNQPVAINLVSFLLKRLPTNYNYNVIFVEKNIDEVVETKGLIFSDKCGPNYNITHKDLIKKSFVESHVQRVREWLVNKPNFNVISVDFNLLATNPVQTINKINKDLELNLNIERCISAIYPQIYTKKMVV